jgi:hypothetical protein
LTPHMQATDIGQDEEAVEPDERIRRFTSMAQR